MALITNTGAGFSLGAAVGVGGAEPRRMAVGDVNADGLLDLVTSNRDSNTVSTMLGTGTGFTFLGTTPAGAEPRGVALADFDGDCQLDLVVGSHDDRTVRVLRGNGAGGFAPSATISVAPARPDDVVTADFDGDHDMDFAVARSDDAPPINDVSVFLNTGGTFGFPLNAPTGGLNPDSLVASDFDGDGDVDVAVSNQDSNTVSIMGNSGTGLLALVQTIAVGAGPSHVSCGDLDRNGSADIVVANEDSDSVSRMLNLDVGCADSKRRLLLEIEAFLDTVAFSITSFDLTPLGVVDSANQYAWVDRIVATSSIPILDASDPANLQVGVPSDDPSIPYEDLEEYWSEVGSRVLLGDCIFRVDYVSPSAGCFSTLASVGSDPSLGFEGLIFFTPSPWPGDMGEDVECGTEHFDSGESYCRANPNSTGSPAIISSIDNGDGTMTVVAQPVPNQPGIFFHGGNRIELPFGNGFLCTGGGLVRLNPPVVASGNFAQRVVDITTLDGERGFQYWFRDPAGGGAAFNTSDAVNYDFGGQYSRSVSSELVQRRSWWRGVGVPHEPLQLRHRPARAGEPGRRRVPQRMDVDALAALVHGLDPGGLQDGPEEAPHVPGVHGPGLAARREEHRVDLARRAAQHLVVRRRQGL